MMMMKMRMSTKIISIVGLTIIVILSMNGVHGSYEECKAQYGPPPAKPTPAGSPPTKPPSTPIVTCDNYNNIGNHLHLDNAITDILNTEVDTETPAMTQLRLTGQMPIDGENFQPKYDPVNDAYCFNEDYPVPSLSSSQQLVLYQDYKAAFDKVFAFTTDVSVGNNRVTNNRIPGMFLRMCFHDNAVDPLQLDFQDYISRSIDTNTKKWIGESRYLKTSGADASHLICPEERYHPNNNYDQTASRVLNSIQQSLKSKYRHMSYADLLHNGCNAATIYLNNTADAARSLSSNPFTFGRKDACFIDHKCKKKFALCGPSELLPGVTLRPNQVNNWFTSRGMTECSFMALMWTHTTVDNMASLCPITKLTCTASNNDVAAFTDRSKLYFKAGDNLDYFNFFLKRGTHETLPFTGDDGDPSCNWVVDGRLIPWPMTGIDCTLGLDNVERVKNTKLADAIKNLGHNRATYNVVDILQCALKVLGGKGGLEGGACNKVVPTECKSRAVHKFGGFYSTLTTRSRDVRSRELTVDPRCTKYGYRRRTLEVSSPEYIIEHHMECLDVPYNMYLVIEGAHFAGLATPISNFTMVDGMEYCPSIVIHTKSESDNAPMEKLIVIASYSEIEQMDQDTKYHLGVRPLSSIINAFDAVSVGYKGTTTYNPVTNNCVGMLRNMADPLDITFDDQIVKFITNRLLLDSADHMFEIIESSPTLKTLYENGNRLLKVFNKEDILNRLIKYYL
jgi:hypothetical protein